MQKRGQAALEFLTTYGWAFLVILIMIGALAYFGILKPSKLLPERCTFGTEIGCQDFVLDGTNSRTILRLKNGVGESIKLNYTNFTSESRTPFVCSGQVDFTSVMGSDGIWANGEVIDVNYTNCNFAATGMISGEKGKVSITLGYYTVRSGPEYKHDVQGEVYATVK